jgi:hypothetical protein
MLGSRRLVIINRSRLTLSRCLEIHHCERKSHVAGNKPSRDAFPQMHDCIYRDVWSQDFLSDRAAVRYFNHFLADIISGLHAGGISQDQVVPFDLVENRELHSWKPNSNCWRHPTMCGLPQPILQRYFVVRQTQRCDWLPRSRTSLRCRRVRGHLAQALRHTMQEVEDAEFETIEPKAVVNTGTAKPTA